MALTSNIFIPLSLVNISILTRTSKTDYNSNLPHSLSKNYNTSQYKIRSQLSFPWKCAALPMASKAIYMIPKFLSAAWSIPINSRSYIKFTWMFN